MREQINTQQKEVCCVVTYLFCSHVYCEIPGLIPVVRVTGCFSRTRSGPPCNKPYSDTTARSKGYQSPYQSNQGRLGGHYTDRPQCVTYRRFVTFSVRAFDMGHHVRLRFQKRRKSKHLTKYDSKGRPCHRIRFQTTIRR